MPQALNKSVSFDTREEVDFVVVGSGAAGGILAKELAAAGHSVVVLEQGPHLQASDFKHDEWGMGTIMIWCGVHVVVIGKPSDVVKTKKQNCKNLF